MCQSRICSVSLFTVVCQRKIGNKKEQKKEKEKEKTRKQTYQRQIRAKVDHVTDCVCSFLPTLYHERGYTQFVRWSDWDWSMQTARIMSGFHCVRFAPGGDSLWGGSFHQRPRSTCHAAAEAEQWLCSQMDQMEGIKTGEPYLLPFPSDPVPAFWDRKPAPWFFPPEKGLDAPPVFFRGGGQGGCRWIFTKHTFAQACCE